MVRLAYMFPRVPEGFSFGLVNKRRSQRGSRMIPSHEARKRDFSLLRSPYLWHLGYILGVNGCSFVALKIIQKKLDDLCENATELTASIKSSKRDCMFKICGLKKTAFLLISQFLINFQNSQKVQCKYIFL